MFLSASGGSDLNVLVNKRPVSRPMKVVAAKKRTANPYSGCRVALHQYLGCAWMDQKVVTHDDGCHRPIFDDLWIRLAGAW